MDARLLQASSQSAAGTVCRQLSTPYHHLHALQLTVKDYVGGRDQQQLFLGPGAATLQSGTRYEGDWCAGKMHGSGDLHFPDGITYTGDMQHNTITGVGVRQQQGVCHVSRYPA
jgi:hypothetical protein